MLFYAHKYCWKVANTPEIIPATTWLRMAIQTRPFDFGPNFPSTEPIFDVGSDLLVADRRFFHEDTDLGGLALGLSKMPIEVQSQVLDDLRGSLFISLLKAKTFAWQVLPRIQASTTLKPVIKTLNANDTIRSIYARQTDIFGRAYLGKIGSNNGDTCCSSLLSISDTSVRGLRFALEQFGLRGVQIMYDSESYPPWLGDSSSCWIGVIQGRDLSKLRIITDVSSWHEYFGVEATSGPGGAT